METIFKCVIYLINVKILITYRMLDSLRKTYSLYPPNPRMCHESGIQGQSSERTVVPSKLFAKCEHPQTTCPAGERALGFNCIFKGVYSLQTVKKYCPGIMKLWENQFLNIAVDSRCMEFRRVWRENRVSTVDIWNNFRFGSLSLYFSLAPKEPKVLPCQTLLVSRSTAP